MTDAVPPPTDVRAIRSLLDEHGYNGAALMSRLGHTGPPNSDQAQRTFEATRVVNAENLLIRLFLLGAEVDSELIAEFIPGDALLALDANRLLRRRGERIRAEVIIVPVDDLLFISDAYYKLGTSDAREFVLPACTHSAGLLRNLTLRHQVASALDLGTGCGVHALFAARHADRVVATDISDAALRYTVLNAQLNAIGNIEVRRGSLFEPVTNCRFDLIVSNPPFVIAPGQRFTYRDNDMPVDGFCEQLVRDAPAHLTSSGHLQMLCEWIEQPGQDWLARISDWIRGCDAWVLKGPSVIPEDYVNRRTTDISGPAVDAGARDDWLRYLQDNDVSAVHPGVLTLRRRDGANWLHVQGLHREVDKPLAQAISAGIEACDFLEMCDDEALKECVFEPATSHWHPEALDDSVENFLALHNGQRTLGDCMAAFRETAGEVDGQKLLLICRQLVAKGFLQPAEIGE